jgi:hypothetical protein
MRIILTLRLPAAALLAAVLASAGCAPDQRVAVRAFEGDKELILAFGVWAIPWLRGEARSGTPPPIQRAAAILGPFETNAGVLQIHDWGTSVSIASGGSTITVTAPERTFFVGPPWDAGSGKVGLFQLTPEGSFFRGLVVLVSTLESPEYTIHAVTIDTKTGSVAVGQRIYEGVN